MIRTRQLMTILILFCGLRSEGTLTLKNCSVTKQVHNWTEPVPIQIENSPDNNLVLKIQPKPFKRETDAQYLYQVMSFEYPMVKWQDGGFDLSDIKGQYTWVVVRMTRQLYADSSATILIQPKGKDKNYHDDIFCQILSTESILPGTVPSIGLEPDQINQMGWVHDRIMLI